MINCCEMKLHVPFADVFYTKTGGSDTRSLGGGPFGLRATTITFENCTANDYSTTFGLEPSAVAT